MGTAQDGFAQIMVEFLFEKPLQEATQDIRDAISAIRDDLPTEMKEPIIKKFNDTDRPIVSLALSSDQAHRRRAHPPGRPGHHARAALDPRRGGGQGVRQASSAS